jgi:predicted nucleic acid-binding Zn ribbon protein
MAEKSKYDKYTKYSSKVDIYPHKHCPVCNAMMDPDNRFCSEKCAYTQRSEGRGKKKKIGLFIGIYIGAIILMIKFLV